MPALPDSLPAQPREAVGAAVVATVGELVKRINIPSNDTSPPGLIEANTRDPWSKSGKYALGWVYFCIILLVFTSLVRFYHLFSDRVRTGIHADEFFPRDGPLPEKPKTQSSVSSVGPINNGIAFFRYIFYHPLPVIQYRKGWTPIVFPSLGVSVIVLAALVFVTLYTFVPQPLYWSSMEYGAPPVAVRSGMLAVAMMPWIIAMSMKANFISWLTGIGHERLNVLHRWGGYLCMFLSLIHTIPFYITPSWDENGLNMYKTYFANQNFYIYGTGIAALVPLLFLCVHSLPVLRRWMYELFVALHVPAAIAFLAMTFWHCNNYLTSWNYLFATTGIWFLSYLARLFFLNWTNPFKLSWLIGDEAAVTILPENAVKVTIPTQVRWRPGQYVYLRMPGISVFENHPFTIASLCSDDFPSEYGEQYRDMVLVFRPFGGFTAKVLAKAMERGPWKTYRAFIDGPYGGMNRRLDAFDHVVLVAGGSGITAIASQLLDLIKRMRDGKAVTKQVHVIWALKRPETMEWFKEELRICREFAPPDSVTCQFFITTAKRLPRTNQIVSATTPTRPVSMFFHDRVNDAFQGVADKRSSMISNKRHSALIQEEAAGDPEREKELRRENEDAISALPKAVVKGGHLAPPANELAQPTPVRSLTEKRGRRANLSLDISQAVNAGTSALDSAVVADPAHAGFDFGFPSTPTEFQKNLMRFAFLPAAVKKKDGWSTEYGRPDIPYMLREMSRDFGKRTCVLVCGPPSMRIAVSETVAELQKDVWRDPEKEELFLHAENYAI